MRALQFGAGKIGRGFFAERYTRSGFEVVFVEAREDLVASLNRHRFCWVEWLDGTRARCAPVSALLPEPAEAVAEAFCEADVVSTAVGVNHLSTIAPIIATGLQARSRAHKPPINILLGENDLHADALLRQALPPLEAEFGIVRCIIGRQVVAEIPDEPPGVRADPYSLLPIDADALVGTLPAIEGVYPVRPFEVYFKRKLYVHNGLHALLAYLGAEKGYATVQQALNDPQIHTLYLRGAEALERAFLKEFAFDPAEHHAMVADVRARIEDPRLDDPIARVAREPMRKLRPEDRLVGAYRLVKKHGEDAEPFWRAILSALRYAEPNDPESVRLQALRRQKGEAWLLREWCQLD